MRMFREILCEIDLSGEFEDQDQDLTMKKWKAASHLTRKKKYKNAATQKLADMKKAMKIKPEGHKGSGFDNPLYMQGGVNPWAGHPDQFTRWTPFFKDQYEQMKNLLQKFGVPTFTKMYYIDKPWHSIRKKRLPGGQPNTMARNFILIADDGRFVWRRYDSGSDYGAAQNWVYIDGEKKYTTDVLSKDKRRVARIMKPIARITGSEAPDNPIDAAFYNEKKAK